jgi:hypothetical protein
MVALWVLPPEIGTIDDEGIVRLNDGRTFDLSNVPGNGYNANRLAKINARIQQEVDDIRSLASLAADDPDKTITPAELLAQYGGRMFLSDADGTPNDLGAFLTTRSVLLWLTWDGSNLIPHVTEVT